MSVQMDAVPEAARLAWTRLRDDLVALLGDDLVAVWAHGGTVATETPRTSADLDTYVVVRRRLDERTAAAVEAIHDAIAGDSGVSWDAWYVAEADARRLEAPPHAFRADRRDTSWAVHRAHWLAGRHVHVHGREPAQLVLPPSWAEIEVDLDREVEHLERHVAEGDTDPYEGTYAILNGSRILHTVETRDPAISKREAGRWALDHLPERWHAALRAALRTYDGEASSDDTDLIAREMAPFVAMVRGRVPGVPPRDPGAPPRWSGY